MVAVTATSVSAAESSPGSGDLTVGWIALDPALPYVWGSTDPTREGWPEEGSTVRWRAQVRNWFGHDVRGVRFEWRLDGAPVASGTIDLAADSFTAVDYPWTWTFDRHRVTFRIDPDLAVVEESDRNNEVSVFTDALVVGLWIERRLYDFFRENQHRLGIGSTSFENWAQRVIDRYNDMAALAVYPETPEGVLDRWRLGKVVVVPDGALPLVPPPGLYERGGEPNESTHPDLSDRTVDLQWGLPGSIVDYYGSSTTLDEVSLQNWFYAGLAIHHELGHARYLTDVYAWDVDLGTGDEIEITENGQPVAGSPLMPFVSGTRAVHQTLETGLMNRDYGWIDRYSAIALNRIAGRRATRGHYNEPENLGEFLDDLPLQNRVTIRTWDGAPLADAEVRIYRSEGERDRWYPLLFDGVPDAVLRTDAEGRVLVGRNPFGGEEPIVHTWRRSNVVAIVRVERAGEVRYGFLESLAFNLAFWRGETAFADHVLFVGPSPCGIHGPVPLEPAWDTPSGRATLARWSAVSGATRYNLWVAEEGMKPRVVATTEETSAPLRMRARGYWWVEAEFAHCPVMRSAPVRVTGGEMRTGRSRLVGRPPS